MSDDKTLEFYYLRQGVMLVDALYDKGFLDQSLARESHRKLDSFFGKWLQGECEAAVRSAQLVASLRDT